MRTTIDLEDQTYDELLRATGEVSKPKAVRKAVEAFLRREKLDRLRALKGKVNILENHELEQAELEALTIGE